MVGRCLFIMSDLRSELSPEGDADSAAKTTMGSAQKAWFKAELARAAADPDILVVFWVTPFPWISPQGGDGWGAYSTERAELAAEMEATIGAAAGMRLIIVSGDMHGLAFDNGRNNRYGPSGSVLGPVVQSGSLDNKASFKGGPYSHGCSTGNGRYTVIGVNDMNTTGIVVEVNMQDIFGSWLQWDTTDTTRPLSPPCNKPLTVTQIIGITAGVVLGTLLIVTAIFFAVYCTRKSKV